MSAAHSQNRDTWKGSTPPEALPVNPAGIPAALRSRPQWVCWQYQWIPEQAKWTKVPKNPRTGANASTTNSATWGTFAEALTAMERRGLPGVGFVLTAADSFAGVDLDACRDPATGALAPAAAETVANLDSYAEWSPSGTGVHVMLAGRLPDGKAGTRTDRTEAYTSGRYLTITGHRLPDAPATIEPRQAALDAFCARVFDPPTETAPAAHSNGRTSPPLADGEIIERALGARNGDRFRRLYFDGDVSGHGGDDSAADLALCDFLAFWTQDAAQIDRLFRRSALYREKWERADYRAATIAKALADTETYQPAGSGARLHVNGRAARDDAAALTIESSPWPVLAPEALYGLAGDAVAAIDPHTEADPVALLGTFLLMFGNAINRGPHLALGGFTRHGTNENALFVGSTSKARKGTSKDGPGYLMRLADDAWFTSRVLGGLSSGEGLIWAIRDPIFSRNPKTGDDEEKDPGVSDKRLFLIEEEFSAVLKAMGRQGNTLSETTRRGWDSPPTLQTLTKNSPAKATNPHVSIIGHVTKDELRRTLTDTEQANGLLNRFIVLCVRRSKALPNPTQMPADAAADLARRITAALAFGRRTAEIRRDAAAETLWATVYGPLSEGKPGLVGATIARGEAHVLRLSLIYALLDCSPVIRPAHLLAALALWEYAEHSVRYVFGDATGDPIADRILAALRATGPMSQDDIVNLFGRHVNGARLGHALEVLVTARKIVSSKEETGGRPRVIWAAT